MRERRTDKVGTKAFIENFIMPTSPAALQDTAVILDNHSAHHSHLVTGFCRDSGLELAFLPAYSSVLNPGKVNSLIQPDSKLPQTICTFGPKRFVHLIFPPNLYICLVERVWGILKHFWGKTIATIESDATAAQVDIILEEVCQKTKASLTGQIVNSSDKYIELSLKGVLV